MAFVPQLPYVVNAAGVIAVVYAIIWSSILKLSFQKSQFVKILSSLFTIAQAVADVLQQSATAL